MRIALIADIHGNCVALDAVLAELEAARVDELICLGDVAALGPQPREVIARLRERQCPVVMGNTDAWLLAPTPGDAVDANNRPLTRWSIAQLSDIDRAYIRAFVPVVARPLDDRRTLLCAHGSPRSYDDAITATTPAPALDAMIDGYDAAIMAGGHTHIQMLRRHQDMQIVNPGSVGLPGVGATSPPNQHVQWAEYAVIDVDGGGNLTIALHRTPLDVERMIATARASGMPDVAWWASKWEQPSG